MQADRQDTSHRPDGHPPVNAGKVGVLLINLGTPDSTSTADVRRYLREFLWDRRVIETPRVLWWLILNGIVLVTRPKNSAHAYSLIWNNERNESPLVTITRSQSEKLAARLAGEGIIVDWAMRYGNPPIADRLKAMQEAGAERILVAPLYPQYSAATTGTANDKVFEALQAMRWQPALRTLPPYYDEPAYIEALAASIEAHLAGLDFEPEVVLASFHGLPRDYVEKGDPYFRHCHETLRLLRERLGWSEERLRLAFQSRFGRAEWLKPYTDETVRELARSGVRRLAVITPGFSADCLETLEEIAIRNGEYFREAGGDRFTAIPCLNDGETGMNMLESFIRREIQGWI